MYAHEYVVDQCNPAAPVPPSLNHTDIVSVYAWVRGPSRMSRQCSGEQLKGNCLSSNVAAL